MKMRLVAGGTLALGLAVTLASVGFGQSLELGGSPAANSLAVAQAAAPGAQPPGRGGRGGGAPGAQPPGRGGADGAQAPGRGGAGAGRGGQAAAPAAPPTASGPVVRVRGGQVQGYLTNSVYNYMGIPFAAPPVGDLRWRPPAQPASWTGVKAAVAPGPMCGTPTPNEDCLYINVHTPEGFRPGDRMPVMVWIYGGAFTGGAGNAGFGVSHDGGNFARKGVVVVTFNYRLGRMGWFSHPAIDAEPGLDANYGVMDQIHALKWVRDNIAQFGGNPGNVTVFGESAGAMSALNLMITPEARGLLHKVVAQSGFPRFVATPLETARAYGVRAQEANNITGTPAQVASALRRLPLSAFPASGGTDDPSRPILIADGRLVQPESFVASFEAGKQAKIPLMVGGNSADIFGITPTAAMWDAVTDRRQALEAAYGPGRNGNKTFMMSDLITDQRMTEPNRALARAHARAGAPTFLYYFSYLAPNQRETAAGAAHLAEVRYVFGTGNWTDLQGFSTSQAMNASWAAFAKYGNPGAASGVAWPRYDLTNEPTLEFASTGQRVVNNNLRTRLDYVLAGVR